ncbi:MAG: ABC transporter permease [Actinomycetota bacterium]|nr:ABC transporter permease [Actinomycetota bacterium]
MTAAAHTWFMFGRHVRNLVRQPVWIVILLVQPFFWLVLYSQLFRRITDLPGFETRSYIEFLTPGIVVMTAFFSGIWNGMSMVNDLDRGIIERFLATPARRSSLVLGHVGQCSLNAVIQGAIVLGIGFLMGARVREGALGWLVILVAASLVAACFSGVSNGIALFTRREESMIAVSNFVGLPLLFFSSALIARDLIPEWMEVAARFNPVEWGVVAAREVVEPGTDWGVVGFYLALLVAATIATSAFATWSFRVYRRTL